MIDAYTAARKQVALAASSGKNGKNLLEDADRSKRKQIVAISPTSHSLTSTAGCNHGAHRTLAFSEPSQ